MSNPHGNDPRAPGAGDGGGATNAPFPATVPEPTYAPAALALGLALATWGVMTHWIMTLTGAALAARALAQWFADIRSGWQIEED